MAMVTCQLGLLRGARAGVEGGMSFAPAENVIQCYDDDNTDRRDSMNFAEMRSRRNTRVLES